MRIELKRLQNELEVTTVYVTHNQEEAMSMADRVVVMNKGTIQQIAPPGELYERPRTAWVARFIGSPPMNLFQGQRRNGSLEVGSAGAVDLTSIASTAESSPQSGEEAVVEAGQSDAGSAGMVTDASQATGDLSLGVRPEDLTVTTSPPATGHALEAPSTPSNPSASTT